MGGIGAPELLILFVVILLLFGAAKLPKLARSMGQAGKEFKSGLKEGYQEEPVEGPCPFCGAKIEAEAKFCPGCAQPAGEVVAERAKQEKRPV